MTRLPLLAALLACFPATASPAPASPMQGAADGLVTLSERSGFVRTGRYDEVIRLCEAFARAYPASVRCESFGTTPEGRPMQVLVVSSSGAFTPEAARAKKLPVTLIQGGIHAGEIDGKDAGFLALRQMLQGQAGKGALERQVLLFVPVFNVDGHERFARWNRPNQRGPEEMGWRTTAQNYNLNRDYAKADTPEMQAMLALVNRWDPLAYVDLHVTNGAKFEHDVSIQVEPVHGGDAGLRKAGIEWRDGVIAALARLGSLPLPFYPSFVEYDNPASGFADGMSPPRFSQSYIAQRNRLGMLVETHSWREYPHRVKVTRNTILAVLDLVARDGRRWQAEAQAADARSIALAGQPVALDYKATDKSRTIDFRGYAYTRTPSKVSGALMTRYDETTPQVWRVPLRDDVVPSLTVAAPGAGYVVPPAHARAVAHQLDVHGIDYRRLGTPIVQAGVQAFRATGTESGKGSVEGHQRLTLQGVWATERMDIPAGSLFVPIAQPLSRLVMALLEPQAPDSIAAWGGFNNAFERKEYMEDYVAEDVAREMLKDPVVQAAFESRLKADAAFAASSAARLEFFARRHSSWDARYNLYPVLRMDQPPR
ncbi:M14 family metallopeptidase [Aerolutibacter ruishenii]|uniref:Zinc carboxypeptidase n=1 Tax=Aerolutibacter ruishenii TaxID=686800 RepID=A0A562LX15_9GAMM|nr:zinc carboxypeptidase [Lysobacter ruishenii]